MNLHEYQAKSLFSDYGIPVPSGQVITDLQQAKTAMRELGGESWMVKAQVHAGGRGKAGGVKRVSNEAELIEVVETLLGSQMVTHQTTSAGQPVNQLLIETPTEFERELYLGMLVDRARERIVFMASAAGGMDIEEIARTQPEKILTLEINPVCGLQAFQCRQFAFALGLEHQLKDLSLIMHGLYKLFTEQDLALLEINPLVVTNEGRLLALDAKINIDDNALYRHKTLLVLRDKSQEDAREASAQEHDLNYVSLDGDIGCMVNGAGLAMATMDLIKLQGGQPANFLDVGGGTTAERVAEALKLIISDSNVKAILVNIFGGIVRCDLIAEGIIQAVKEVGISIPVVVRLEGTNAQTGRTLLAESGLKIIASTDLTDAAIKAVAAAGENN
jgi:succinyl-CoA synthetase beta subunit